MYALMDTAASTGGFPVFSNTANQALIGQQYDLLLFLSAHDVLFSFLNSFFLMVENTHYIRYRLIL
jgi:hypothetical protein